MGGGGGDGLGEEAAGGALAGGGFTQDAAAASKAGDDGGADRALEVEDGIVISSAESSAQRSDFMQGFEAQKLLAPVFGGGEVEVIDERLGRGEGLERGEAGGGSEEGLPSGFDDPVNDPCGVGLAERGDGGECVEEVAHGAEAHDEEAKVGLRWQTPIFSQRGARRGGIGAR